MFRLPSPHHHHLRTLLHPKHYSRPYSTSKTADPLDILFCGSDDFSAVSLRALHRVQQTNPTLINSIAVVHRPGKPTGRGMKTIREVPLAQTAHALNLPTHPLDSFSFTGWNPPPTNLIIAVSFGLLIPPRILDAASYGGLNVHPSLLPDLRGAAPITHTLLRRRTRTGVSVQTLHPERFDRGVVLRQTESPGLAVSPDATVEGLTAELAEVGAEMLVRVLEERAFVPPVVDAGWFAGTVVGDKPLEYAGKISTADRCVKFGEMGAEEVLTRQRVLGGLWCLLPGGERVVFNRFLRVEDGGEEGGQTQEGEPGLFGDKEGKRLFARVKGGEVLEVGWSTLAGGKKGKGNKRVIALLRASSERVDAERKE